MLSDEFETDLREALLRKAQEVPPDVVARLRGQRYRPRGPRRYVVMRLAAVMALAGGVAAAVVTQSTGPESRPASLSWRLVSDITQAWHESQPKSLSDGVSLTCPAASTCYARVLLLRPLRLYSRGTPRMEKAYRDYLSNEIAIEVTHDGGASWQRADLPADVTQVSGQFGPIDCLSKDTCLTLVSSTSWKYEIAKTTDGGHTWTTLPGPAPLSTQFGVDGGISCVSGTSCVLIGSYAIGTPKGGRWYAEVTTDSGQTWTQVPMPASLGSAGMQCFSGGKCITPGAYSTDGGHTWAEGSLPSGILGVWGMSCGDSSHCVGTIVSPSHTKLVVTSDGGQTWTQDPDNGWPTSLLSVTCASASTCWAAGSTVPMPLAGQSQQHPKPILDSTNDQGRTWQTAQLPARYGIIAVGNVSCSATTSCFAIAQSTHGLVFLSYGR